jgi:hypothetical protein
MHTSEHNKKVAFSRWSKILAKEKERIPKTDEALRQKAALCGFLAGDGCVWARQVGHNFQYRISLFPDDKTMLSKYCDILLYLYDKQPNVRTGHGKCFEAAITSRTIYEDLTCLADFGIKRWGLPSGIFSVRGAKEAWLKGFFSAEAYVGKSTIKLQTVNEEGMRAVSQLLNDVGIANSCYKYTPKNKNHSRVHIILIRKKEALLNFHEKIGFWHAKKTEALKKSLDL